MNTKELIATAQALVAGVRQQGMATFCKPFTKATIRYVDHVDAAVARNWLGEA